MFARYIFRHSRYFALILIAAIAVGINGFNAISRQEDPTLTNYVASIKVFLPGASPDRMEALVTRPMEDELRKISEINEIKTISSSGVAVFLIKLTWELSDEGLDLVWSEVRDAMSEAARGFPPGTSAPAFDNDQGRAFTTIVALSSPESVDAPLSVIHRVAQELADRARNLPNTRLVEIFGEPEEEIRVEIDESALLARGLSLNQVSMALQAADVKVASGRAIGAGTDMLVELAGDLDSLDRIRQVILNTSQGGSATHISDLGHVYKAAASPPTSLALAEGRPAILLGAMMEPGSQIDVWSDAFSDMLEEFRAEAPTGLTIALTYDQSLYARARLAEVAGNLVVGVTLVLLVLLFTLGWRAAVVVAVILPICGLISIAIMERAGLELQQMSVTGLIVALGLLVDGSIVMTDEIRQRLLQGHSQLEAISGSVHRLRTPLIASALTTVLTFIPMVVAPGPPGDFIGSIASAVIIMLLVSTVLALIVTPVLCAWLLPRVADQNTRWYTGGMNSGRLGKGLSAALDWSLRHPAGAICLALSLPVSGFLSFPTLTAQFFPTTDRDQFHIQVKFPDGRSIDESLRLAQILDARLRSDALIRRVDWTIGESPPPFFYNMGRTRKGIPSWAEALVLTRDKRKTDEFIRKLQREFDRDYPQAQIVVRGINQGPPVAAPLEVEIYGPDLAVLQALGEEIRQRMDRIPLVIHTAMGLAGGAPKLEFQLDEGKLRLANLQLLDAAAGLKNSLEGSIGGEVLQGTERLPVRVRFAEREWGTADRINNIRLSPAAGSALPTQQMTGVPLNAVGTAMLLPAQSPITRIDGRRINTVQGYLTRGVLPEEALQSMQAVLAQDPVALPHGYYLRYGGDTKERTEAMAYLMAPIGLVIAGLLATILITFNSWRLSAVAVLVCVCSMGLSLLCLAVFDYAFGILPVMGVIGSIGVAINAAIIIMTALQAHESAAQGNPLAIRTVVMDSSRHITSTTITTFGGFLPLILEGGKFWPPFAMAIAGGVLLSTIISFFLVPPMFLLCTRLSANRLFGSLAVQHPEEARQ